MMPNIPYVLWQPFHNFATILVWVVYSLTAEQDRANLHPAQNLFEGSSHTFVTA